MEAYFDKLTQGKITYSRNGKKSTEDRIVYGIKADGGTIAEAEVLKTKISLGYGFYEYEAKNSAAALRDPSFTTYFE